MAERRRTTPKAQGKAISIDRAPSELPKDLPKKFPYKFSWKIPQNDKMVLLEIINQGALDEKFPNGFLKKYKGLKTFLKDEGLIREEDCKCIVRKYKDHSTVACDKMKGKKVFKVRDFIIKEKKDVNETELIHLLKTCGPIAAEIEVTGEYMADRKGNIYYGPSKNMKARDEIVNHIVLVTGYDTDPSGVSYFEFQNTWGVKWRENGYGKLAKKVSLRNGEPSLIKSYMYPELLDQIMDI